MGVRDDGSLILATHNRAYPTAAVAPLVPSSGQLWVKSGHFAKSVRCLLNPRKRTFTGVSGMSALCLKRKSKACWHSDPQRSGDISIEAGIVL